MTAPTTTIALSDAKALIELPTVSNSSMLISKPAVILTRIPRAPAKSTSSSNGLEIAASAASSARSSPEATPVPIIAVPISLITVRTSAKSTLIRPGRVINSAIPCTAPSNTLFAALKASNKLTPRPNTFSSLSLGMVIKESTCSLNASIPACA